MKTKTVSQEILLITTTTLVRKDLCEKDTQQSKTAPVNEQLEEACWNGLLEELLPGIIERSARGRKLFLWQVIQCNSFLEIDLGELPGQTDNELSLNPYFFLNMISCN